MSSTKFANAVEYYNKAITRLNENEYEESLLASRKALEHIIFELCESYGLPTSKNTPGVTLETMINSVGSAVGLRDEQIGTLHRIRILGNKGSHAGTRKPTSHDAQDAVALLSKAFKFFGNIPTGGATYSSPKDTRLIYLLLSVVIYTLLNIPFRAMKTLIFAEDLYMVIRYGFYAIATSFLAKYGLRFIFKVNKTEVWQARIYNIVIGFQMLSFLLILNLLVRSSLRIFYLDFYGLNIFTYLISTIASIFTFIVHIYIHRAHIKGAFKFSIEKITNGKLWKFITYIIKNHKGDNSF